MGSSPLARGLREHEVSEENRGRIIPARAGFTRTAPGRERAGGDHPRSRGVYVVRARVGRAAPGSSPLARGLLRALTRAQARERIIPARAGFTSPSAPSSPSGGDHPRSRGVYSKPGPTRPTRVGSSPLARGLRGPGGEASDVEGIIPARAGFTREPVPAGRSVPDHPRSRGVYASSSSRTTDTRGSSPLARGLLRVV